MLIRYMCPYADYAYTLGVPYSETSRLRLLRPFVRI